VSKSTIISGHGVGEDGVTYNGTVYVLTVTHDGPNDSCPAK
jgi:hypothetical protein